MGQARTDEFRNDAAHVALTSGLTHRQIADDLGVGMSTLNQWIPAHPLADSGLRENRKRGETDVGPTEDREHVREKERLRSENRDLKPERDIQKNRPGPLPACARY